MFIIVYEAGEICCLGSIKSTLVIKYTIGLIRDGDDLIKDFVDWCQQNHLQLSAGKTKELVVAQTTLHTDVWRQIR